MPSKLAGILGVGRPVVFVGDKDNSLAAAILREPCGCVIPEGDVRQLGKIIEGWLKNPEDRNRLGEFARNLFDREYDRVVVVPKIIARIEPNPLEQ